jgi:hypothetical protein
MKLNYFLKKCIRVNLNNISIIESSIDSKEVKSKYIFHNHNYYKIKYLLKLNRKDLEYSYLDTSSSILLVDKSISTLLL